MSTFILPTGKYIISIFVIISINIIQIDGRNSPLHVFLEYVGMGGIFLGLIVIDGRALKWIRGISQILIPLI